MKTYAKFKKQLLQDREIRKAYEELGPEFALVKTIIKKRIEKRITQAALARKIGTKQSAISRLESGEYNPTLAFLGKVARALDSKLEVSIS